MAILKAAQFEQILRTKDHQYAAVLIFGPDRGRVRESAKKLVEANSGSSDDPFDVVQLDDDVLSKDPARLSDESRSISFMGGERSVWIRDAGNGFFGAAKSYLVDADKNSLIVAEAGDLRKGLGLRTLFEKAKNAACLACYEDTARDIHGLIEDCLRADNLTIGNDARMALASMLGGDRALTRSELEKLALYCRGRDQVTLDDVELVCGNTSVLAIDDMIDAVFGGDLNSMDTSFNRLAQSGITVTSILMAASSHTNKLHRMALQIETGKTPRQVIDAARPPVFWKRKDAIMRQLGIWEVDTLEAVGLTLADAEFQTRQNASLSAAIAGRAFLSLSRRAYGIRMRGN